MHLTSTSPPAAARKFLLQNWIDGEGDWHFNVINRYILVLGIVGSLFLTICHPSVDYSAQRTFVSVELAWWMVQRKPCSHPNQTGTDLIQMLEYLIIDAGAIIRGVTLDGLANVRSRGLNFAQLTGHRNTSLYPMYWQKFAIKTLGSG